MKKHILLALVGALLGCSSDGGGRETDGTARAGEPCTSASDCAEGLLCQKDMDGDFVCTVDTSAGTDGTDGASGGDGTDTPGTEDTMGPDINTGCPSKAPDGATCNPYCNLGCEDGEHCTWVGGAFGCVEPRMKMLDEACSQSANDCGESMACINIGDGPVCRRFCNNDMDCGPDRTCSITINFPGGSSAVMCSEITTGCDPHDASSCPEGEACYIINQVSKCAPAGELAAGELCTKTGAASCAPGLQCLIECSEICNVETDCASKCGGPESFFLYNADNKVGACLSDAPAAECDLYLQTGCETAEGCYLTNAGLRCLGAGSIEEGEACMFTSDCLPGAICVNQRCQKACSVAEGADAAISCDQNCPAFQQVSPVAWNIGFCSASSTCDFWSQNCEAADENCYVTGSGAVCMTPGNEGAESASCQGPNDCVKGLMCIQNTCMAVCSLDELNPNATICAESCTNGFDPVSLDAQIGMCTGG